ncbi:hypothetical protein [Microvirga aerophila]|uniref:hypothetical protein n=1 Tax=Microvirga aerophila TaxID=670291 RepID=UPI0011BE982C|nr:hypothetical protein [Microvirga aerophila]
MNNGDGFRVLRSALVDYELEATPYTRFPVDALITGRENPNYQSPIPSSTSGAVALGLSVGLTSLGIYKFHFAILSFIYFLCFFCGIILLYSQAKSKFPGFLIVVTTLLALSSPTYVGYFNSVFEEAATLALAPLWVALFFRAVYRDESGALFLVVSALVAFSSKSAFLFTLPICALAFYRPRVAHFSALFVVVTVQVALFNIHMSVYPHANNFNRVFNGIAYATSGVSGWPAYNFSDRMKLAPERVTKESFEASGLPSEFAAAWGKGYWPLGKSMDVETRQRFSDLGALTNFVKTFYRYLPLICKEASFSAFRSDLSLGYLYNVKSMHTADERFGPFSYYWSGGVLLAIGGMLACATGALRRNLPWSCAGAAVLLAPTYVVIGDGFYEFEKHLAPFLGYAMFLIPASIIAAVECRAPEKHVERGFALS